jgi:hypothetical protein
MQWELTSIPCWLLKDLITLCDLLACILVRLGQMEGRSMMILGITFETVDEGHSRFSLKGGGIVLYQRREYKGFGGGRVGTPELAPLGGVLVDGRRHSGQQLVEQLGVRRASTVEPMQRKDV